MENIRIRTIKIIFYSILAFFVFVFLFQLLFYPLTLLNTLRIMNILGLTALFGIFTVIGIAYWTYQKSNLERIRTRTKNQLKILLSLLGELDVLEGENTNGNLNWYLKILMRKDAKKSFSILDHPVNPITFERYIASLDTEICKEIGDIRKFIRELSLINDKIYQINFHVKEMKEKKLDLG